MYRCSVTLFPCDATQVLRRACSTRHVLVFSAKVAEEKLRYAAYNCIAIDTDFMSPWDE